MCVFDTSEFKITYLIGAGASATALPTVRATANNLGIPNTLRHFSKNLKSNKIISVAHEDFVEKVASDLLWVAENSEIFGTPDTFAKFLYLKQRSDLPRLKNALSFYFTVEQLINKKFDKRPLIFLTTVMQIGSIFPTNIKILNWNYDFQIQIAGEVFSQEEFHASDVTIHKPPLINYYPAVGRQSISNHEDSFKDVSMVHLNGIAGIYFHTDNELFMSSYLNSHSDNINDLIESYIVEYEKKHHLLTFAWEKNTEANILMDKRVIAAKNTAKDTDILVVIGYSFPFFNRQIDNEIFQSLKESGRLKKIFFQDPYRDGDFLKNHFELSENIEINHVSDVENYYVPFEL